MLFNVKLTLILFVIEGPDVPHAALEGSTPLPVPTLALSPSNGGGSAGTSPSGTEGISGVGKRTDISVNNHHHQQHQQLNHRSSAGQLHTRNVVSVIRHLKKLHFRPILDTMINKILKLIERNPKF